MPGRGTNCRRRRYASAVPSTFHKSWTLGFARRGEAHARARCARRACGGAGSSLACLCARLELVEGLRNRPRLRSVRCGAGWGTRCGAPARGRAGRTAARGRTDGSRPRAASRGAPGPASVVAWCSARCGAQCGVRLGRRPLAASVWHGMRVVRGDVVGAREGAEQHARGPFGRWGALSAHAALRGPRARPSLSATRALCGRGDMKKHLVAPPSLRGRSLPRRPLSWSTSFRGLRNPKARTTSRCPRSAPPTA